MREKRKRGRPPIKPYYCAEKILQEQIEAVVKEYVGDGGKRPLSLNAIGKKLNMTSVKVRKLLITAGVYESEKAEQVALAFNRYRKLGLDYSQAVAAVMDELKLSRPSVLSYLPYSKTVYFHGECDKSKISVGAERIRRMREKAYQK